MKPEEQSFLRDHLEKSQSALDDVLSEIPPGNWNTEPATGGWSASHCAEHTVIVLGRVLQGVQALSEMPEETYNQADTDRKDEMVLKISQVGEKIQAPATIQPTSKYESPASLLADARQVYQKYFDLVDSNPEWLRGRFREHPILKKLDGYQWILAASCHTLRHVSQLREIKQQLAAS